MSAKKAASRSLVNRLLLFLLFFSTTLITHLCISRYQSESILRPQQEWRSNIQSISQFLNDTESILTLLQNYRWDYGDPDILLSELDEHHTMAELHIQQIDYALSSVGEPQYLLANAAVTTYNAFSRSLSEITQLLKQNQPVKAAALYYDHAAPCGSYLQQYTQQLLEQAILDGQSSHDQLSRINLRLGQLQSVIILLCLIFGTLVIVNMLTLLRSVQALARAAKDISAGNLEIPDLETQGENELAQMACAFNEMKHSMRHRIQLLGERNEIQEALHKKETETLELQNLMEQEKLQKLRSQINPHFLFNTLNVIIHTARQEAAEKTIRMLTALSQLFRYALVSNQVEVPLSREVHIVNEFFHLQQVRFGSRVNLVWKVSPDVDLTETLVPSFMLQPLVENAFKHGIAPKEDGGTVTIEVFAQEQTLWIRICDDGVGIPAAQLEALRRKLTTAPVAEEHIGLHNVAARMRLRGNSGLEINSSPGTGTAILLHMPRLLLQEEDYTDDENSDC